MTKFLYGASVQGIQSFILQTTKLKEIAGASELVESICTSLFAEQIGETADELAQDQSAVLNAAGNIKYIFTDEDTCRKVFLEFPKKVLEAAPGITISQAVVKCDGKDFADAVNELERKLRAQRNLPAPSVTCGLMGVQRSRATGLPVAAIDKVDGYLDRASVYKREAAKNHRLFDKAVDGELGKLFKQPYDIEKMTGHNDWIAIIHADGNGLGKVVRQIGKLPDKFKRFSASLDKATTAAARKATAAVIRPEISQTFPIRPVVIGGDDLTVIIRADMAVDFTKEYLKEFEIQTKSLLGTIDESFADGLTACAGIAYIKSSFPYYYGYSLAEELCSAAKKGSNRAHSCLMFHKVQDSFILSYEDIEKRELTVNEELSFRFGPYYLESDVPAGKWSIDKLQAIVTKIDSEDGNVVKSGIRQWLSLILERGDTECGRQKIDRMKSIASRAQQELTDTLTNGIYSGKPATSIPAYDVLSLYSVTYQKTK